MPKFSVAVSAMAVVITRVEVEAFDSKEAESLAIELCKNGDIEWRYNGVQDYSFMVDDIQEKK